MPSRPARMLRPGRTVPLIFWAWPPAAAGGRHRWWAGSGSRRPPAARPGRPCCRSPQAGVPAARRAPGARAPPWPAGRRRCWRSRRRRRHLGGGRHRGRGSPGAQDRCGPPAMPRQRAPGRGGAALHAEAGTGGDLGLAARAGWASGTAALGRGYVGVDRVPSRAPSTDRTAAGLGRATLRRWRTIPDPTAGFDAAPPPGWLACGRIAVGAALVVFPGVAGRRLVRRRPPGGGDESRRIRALGVRDALRRAGHAQALEEGEQVRPWLVGWGHQRRRRRRRHAAGLGRHLPKRKRFLALLVAAGQPRRPWCWPTRWTPEATARGMLLEAPTGFEPV